MIKVVIVDDEPKLRQGLQTLIPWESLGFSVAATAGNGKEALKVIGETKPEVVISDIRMPVMDGLQLIERLKSNGQQLHCLILSGYADFEYAQQGIKYGVDGYLLKPVNISEMSASLIELRGRIEEERLQRERRQGGIINRELSLHSLLVPQETTEDPAKWRSKAQQSDLLWASYEVMMIYPRVPEADRSAELSRLSAGLKQGIEGRNMGLVTIISPCVILLLNTPLRGRQRRDSMYSEIRRIAGDTRIVAATGGAVTEPAHIGSSYIKAREAVKQAFFSPKDSLLEPVLPCYPSPVLSQASIESYEVVIEELIFRLYYCLDAGNKTMVLQLLNEAAAFFIQQGQDEKSVKQSFFFLSNAIIHKLAAASRIELKETEMVSRFLNGIYQQDHLQDLLDEIHCFLLEFADEFEPGGKEQELKKMIDFIHRHSAEDLKLSSLAGLLNYSTPYLGQLFRNKTGEYFNTYLDKVRIQKAKELLGQGMKVYEVAEHVGFTNVNYFHSKFKKYEGRSPSDYKIHN